MSNDFVQTEVAGSADSAGALIAQGATMVQTRTGYTTAVQVQKKRDLKEVTEKVLQEAALAGEACYYGWGAGKDRIEGPSIELAMIVARNFGNCAVITRDPIETQSAYILSTDVIDLETGFTYCRPFRQSKRWTVHGKMDDIRKEDVRFQIGVSKSQRNSVLRMMPGWLISKAMDKAKAGVREQLEGYIKKNSLEGARKKALDALTRYGVNLERIEEKYGLKYGAWDLDTLVLLSGDINALNQKMESADVLFPVSGIKVNPETGEVTETGEGDENPPNGKLDPSMMSAGDPATHQGYQDGPKKGDSKKADEKPGGQMGF